MAKKLEEASYDSVMALPTVAIPVPVRILTPLQNLALGFRQPHLDCEHGCVGSGAGLGSPWIDVTWKGRHWAVHVQDLLAALLVHAGLPQDADLVRATPVASRTDVSARRI